MKYVVQAYLESCFTGGFYEERETNKQQSKGYQI
jgi:hypothetical protein